MSLETVSKIVTAHSEPSAADAQKIEKAQTEQAIVRRIVKATAVGSFIFGIGIVLLVFDKSFVLTKWLDLFTKLVMLSVLGLLVYVVWPLLGFTSSGSPTAKTVALTEPDKSLREERFPIPVPSVTERTTQLISPQDVSKSDE